MTTIAVNGEDALNIETGVNMFLLLHSTSKICVEDLFLLFLSFITEGEGNHSTLVISRLGLVGGGGAVVMV